MWFFVLKEKVSEDYGRVLVCFNLFFVLMDSGISHAAICLVLLTHDSAIITIFFSKF